MKKEVSHLYSVRVKLVNGKWVKLRMGEYRYQVSVLGRYQALYQGINTHESLFSSFSFFF